LGFNPNDHKQVKRLREAIGRSRRLLEPFRVKDLYAKRQYLGRNYSDTASEKRVPINLLELAIQIYTRALVPGNPRALVGSDFTELRDGAADLDIALNQLILEIDIETTLKRCVKNAMFSMGIIKVGLASGAIGEIMGFRHDVGQPFADNVSLDDWVHDMTAKRWEQVGFAGNRYRLPLEEAKELEVFAKEEREKLQAVSSNSTTNQDGDEREETLSRGQESEPDAFKPYTEVWDLWLPMEQLLITVPAEEAGGTMPLKVIEWDGDERGPFHILGFNEVPGQIMPLAPAHTMLDLHELANKLFRKLGEQAQRQKTVLGVQGGALEDGTRVMTASDGEIIRLDSPQMTREYKFGGIDQTTLAFCLQIRDLFSYFAGNLDALGGLGPQSDTVGQDRLITSTASERMAEMQAQTLKFVGGVFSSLAQDMWNDPLIAVRGTKRVGDFEIGIPMEFTPERREGDFFQYNIKVDPFSMQQQTPGTKLQTVNEVLERIVFPLLPVLEAQGAQVDVKELVSIIAKFTNTEELNRIIVYADGPAQKSGGPTDPVKQSPVTTRRYERINRPGATTQGKSQANINALLGVGQQPAEAAQIGRPVG